MGAAVVGLPSPAPEHVKDLQQADPSGCKSGGLAPEPIPVSSYPAQTYADGTRIEILPGKQAESGTVIGEPGAHVPRKNVDDAPPRL